MPKCARSCVVSVQPASLWTAIAVQLVGSFYFYTGFRVGNLRGKRAINHGDVHREISDAYSGTITVIPRCNGFAARIIA
jgi:hypothetical protein